MARSVITSWKDLKWETLRYFLNENIILAVFSEEDYFKDTTGFTDPIRRENPLWHSSYIGEDILREFDKHVHRKKAIWMNLMSRVKLSDIKFIFSFLSQRQPNEGKIFPITFTECCFCGEVKWQDLHPRTIEKDTHLIPGGQTCDACAKEGYTEQEKEEAFSQTIITGL